MCISRTGGHSLTDHVYFGDHISKVDRESTQIIKRSQGISVLYLKINIVANVATRLYI